MDGAVEQDPAQELDLRDYLGDVVDCLQAELRAAVRRVGQEVDLGELGVLPRSTYEVEQAAADTAHGRDRQLTLADGSGERPGQHPRGMALGGGGIVDPQRQGGHRQAVQELEGVGETLVLEIEHEVDLALAMQLDLLGTMAVGAPEAKCLQHLAKGTRVVPVVDELDELDPADPRWPRATCRADPARKSSLKISWLIGPR